MKVAITGGTGFVGHHLSLALIAKGHSTILISRGLNPHGQTTNGSELKTIGTSDVDSLYEALKGCDAVAHCAGINRELKPLDYDTIHIKGTANVIEAAKRAGVKKIALLSFYRARPNCGSRYHESKFAAEELVRNSGLDYTIIKAGMIYGKGDHMLDHLSHVFYTLPVFALVGFQNQIAAPLAILDVVRVLEGALLEGRLSRQTVALLGPEKLTLGQAVVRVAKVVGKVPLIFRMPVWFHYGMAAGLEALMKIPLVSIAQVRILTEGFDQPYGDCQELPQDLKPTTMFTENEIRKGLPDPGPFTLNDLRCYHARI